MTLTTNFCYPERPRNL